MPSIILFAVALIQKFTGVAKALCDPLIICSETQKGGEMMLLLVDIVLSALESSKIAGCFSSFFSYGTSFLKAAKTCTYKSVSGIVCIGERGSVR